MVGGELDIPTACIQEGDTEEEAREKETHLMDEFDYCELKFGNCICRKNGKCICALVEREFQDPALIESARLDKAAKEQAKRAKYIMPSHAREMMRFTPPVIRKELLYRDRMATEFKSPFADAMRERPSWAEQVEEKRDMAIMKPNPREDGQSLRERRLGIAKEKRKPHHAFLEDPTRRRRK